MKGKRIKIEVEVNLDQVPGWGHRPSDYVEHVQRLLDQTIPHYDPKVTYVGAVEKPVKIEDAHQDEDPEFSFLQKGYPGDAVS